MNKEAIDLLIERTPKLKSSRHTLERMTSGTYCIHRSWGFGQIKSYDEANNKLIIDFKEGKEGHAMDPAFCIDKLEIVDNNHILARQFSEPDTIAEMVKKQPVEVVIEILSSHPDGTATASELEYYLTFLLGKAKFKKWWANARKLLVKDPRVAVPVKKRDPYLLRDEPLTPEQEILEEFYANKNPNKKILLAEKLYQLSGSVEEIANDLPQILEDLTEAIKNAKQLNQADRLHGVWVRNDLCRHLCEDVEALEPTSTSMIKATDDLSELAEELPTAYYKRFLDLLSRVYPEDWDKYVLNLLKQSVGKFTGECISFLLERDYSDLLEQSFQKWLNEHALRGPVLYWIVKNRNTRRFHRIIKDIIGPRLLHSIFYAIDTESLQQTTNRRILLAEYLQEDSDLIPELLENANLETAQDLAHTLMLNQGFENLTKKSLLARFIKKFPEIQNLLTKEETQSIKEDKQLIVSSESCEKLKKEYEGIVSEKLPEVKEAIARAREHGDLRENAEYKMARQDQEMLLARKAQLEADLASARVTDFSEVTNENVGIGSVVQVEEGSTGKIHEYAILGAWDSNPDKNILSYKTPLAKNLLTKSIGDRVSVEIGGNEEVWTIKDITRWVDRKDSFSKV